MTRINVHLATAILGIFISIVSVQSQLQPTYSNYGENCSPGSILGPRLCKLYERYTKSKSSKLSKFILISSLFSSRSTFRTVKCTAPIEGTCTCNLGDDAYFHEELQLCVSKVNGLCLIGGTELGRKLCTDNADCVPENEREDGHTIGTCQCLPGWEEEEGLCTRSTNLPATGTPRTTSTKRPLFPGTSESTTTTTVSSSTQGTGGAAQQVGTTTGLWAASIVGTVAVILNLA